MHRKEMTMTSENPELRSLRDMELEVLAEGRDWMRQRLERKLQAEATRQGGVFPPKRSKGAASAKRAGATAHRRGGD